MSSTAFDSPHENAPSPTALAIERAGQEATKAAVREHLRSGRAVYYTDAAYPEGTIKELPDGQRFLVRLGETSAEPSPRQERETVLRKIEPRREETAGVSSARSVPEQ